MSELGEKIAAAQRWVVDYEAGPDGPEPLWSVPVVPLLESQSPLEFAADLYFDFRSIEAVANRQKGRPVASRSTAQAIRWARDQESLIRRQLEKLEGFQPTTEWEEAGKLFVEEKLRWALGRLDAFETWGY